MDIVPLGFAGLVAAIFFALFIRTQRELMSQKDAIIDSRDVTIARRDAEIVKLDEYVDILRGENNKLTELLARCEGTWTARIAEAKRQREIDSINHPLPDGLDDEHRTRDDEPAADWMVDDE